MQGTTNLSRVSSIRGRKTVYCIECHLRRQRDGVCEGPWNESMGEVARLSDERCLVVESESE